MSPDPKGVLPPMPRERGGPTVTELIPFRSKKINIWRSKALLPFMLIAVAVVTLFATMDQPALFLQIVAWLGILSIFLAVYLYSGIHKQWWWYLAPALLCWWLLAKEFYYYAFFFRRVLPGNLAAVAHNTDFLPNFSAYFFAAGLCEEALKATPLLLGLALALVRRPSPAGPTPGLIGIFRRRRGGPGVLDALALRSPLDGMLMGLASGAAFILFETLGQYVPQTIDRVFKATNDDGVARLVGLELMLPRILQAISGHMGWAAIFGYFIGLSARYPRRAAVLIPIGYLVAATLHGLWDSVDKLPYPRLWYGAVSVVSVLIFVACLLKAKQLNLAGDGGGSWRDSILIGAFAPPELPARKAAVPVATPATPGRFSIGTAEARYAIEAGHVIDFGALFGAAGVVGEIDPHPAEPGVLGIRNAGSAAWSSTTPDGVTVSVPPGKSLRVAAGTRVVAGTAAVDIRAY